ncbi:glycosyltransferase family 2 protein [Pelomonas sp. KK5]|uniref:glycosyltransferase family 2 protein n=1 Tax=Pelomonas sp. KK5 TaxID=1855730 RepID=UPI00097C3DE3|nr:glycosyltransferase family 2 protein [Pelomonas sp. KK5]
MKFSIITCTWNSEATLAETIASVNAQQEAEVEHIFVDGGSKDGTLAMIERMAPRAVVLRDVGGGISRAMNEGIKAASGNVIAHLHSDDYYCDGQVLRDVASALSSSGRPWLVGGIDRLVDGQRMPGKLADRTLTAFNYFSGAATIPHPAVFIRHELFQRCGMFDEGLRYAMDIDLWLRLLPQAEPVELRRSLTVFREHAGSVSTANVLAARAEELKVRMARAQRHPLASLIFRLRYERRIRRLRRELGA